MVRNNKLYLVEKKGGENYEKNTIIPLNAFALLLIDGVEGLLFEKMAQKEVNAGLKIIAGICKIDKSLSFHCARDTFGTIFVEMGGDIKSLQMLMGHTNLKTTTIYLKMSEERRVNLMANFDKLMAS